ncbi:gibberellin 2-beta-dioxygenase 8-like [Cucurbita pepo subsp. pepo]|uniref:gibberellin 2-beta-dioxygenase 8-like n=1 Tax=Cucurbita pepo subsp. pepo TaxID=3664 RepID=UPI000C9D4581|nr:gibberellin 2-beta-dioxygenase 8-like [Cucurbita pepo subsp. pepo]
MMNSNPPLFQQYELLLQSTAHLQPLHNGYQPTSSVLEECQLPLVDLKGLESGKEKERMACSREIFEASAEWGFFQVINHGIRSELLSRMSKEQMKLFAVPFENKSTSGILDNSYRWGAATATQPNQFSWSEAFHIPLTKVSEADCYGDFIHLREVMEELATAMSKLARSLAGVLVESLGHRKEVFEDMCDESTCFLRLNHYPICPFPGEVTGLVPHTDSDYLTILHQDAGGGLELMKGSQWVAVKPIPEALVVNIGDLLQAWSNDTYKSVKHRVVTNSVRERYSTAYFLCPSNHSGIGSCRQPSPYRHFTFGEYRKQVRDDVEKTGYKVGLSRFRL